METLFYIIFLIVCLVVSIVATAMIYLCFSHNKNRYKRKSYPLINKDNKGEES